MTHLLRRHRGDLLALLVLFILPLLWFAPTLFPALTGRTLLPYDNLYAFEPWRSLQPNLIPHNELLSDLVLENAVWKLHIRRTLAAGQLPLWNPQIFTGLPFLAAGQASTFYPFSLLFVILPLEMAYAWFTALQIGLAGANMYVLGRVLRLRPLPALLGGVLFMFSGFLIVSVVFTMFLAAAAWLPLILAIVEMIVRKQEEKGLAGYSPIPYVAIGAVAIGVERVGGPSRADLLHDVGDRSLFVCAPCGGLAPFARFARGRGRAGRTRRRLSGWACGDAGRVAARHGRPGPGVGRHPTAALAGAAAAELPRRLRLPGAGARLGVALAPGVDLLAARCLRQPQPSPLAGPVGGAVDARHRQRAGRADPHTLLGHQKLRGGRQLPQHRRLAAGCDRGSCRGSARRSPAGPARAAAHWTSNMPRGGSTYGFLLRWRRSRCSSPSARRCTRCSSMACPAGTSCIAPFAGSSPLP